MEPWAAPILQIPFIVYGAMGCSYPANSFYSLSRYDGRQELVTAFTNISFSLVQICGNSASSKTSVTTNTREIDDLASLGNQPRSRIAIYGIIRHQKRRVCGRLPISGNGSKILYNRNIYYAICRTASNHCLFIHQVSYRPTHRRSASIYLEQELQAYEQAVEKMMFLFNPRLSQPDFAKQPAPVDTL